jgi:hypothetical protein
MYVESGNRGHFWRVTSQNLWLDYLQFLDDFARLSVDCEWGNASLTIQELIEEQRRRLRSANPAERLAAVLLIPSVLAKRLSLLGDPQLAQLLEDEVWSRMNLLAPESTICLAAVDRLRGHVNRQHKPNESDGGI